MAPQRLLVISITIYALFTARSALAHDLIQPPKATWRLTSIENHTKQNESEFLKQNLGSIFIFDAGTMRLSDQDNQEARCRVKSSVVPKAQVRSLMKKLKNPCKTAPSFDIVYDLTFSCPDAISPVDEPFPKYFYLNGKDAAVAFENGVVFCLARAT